MIIVTGGSRSGTSLMMQTLKILGVDVDGEEFGPNDKRFNPKGYWEPSDINNITGEAAKVFGGGLELVSPTKIILCTRNQTDALKSTVKWLEGIGLDTDNAPLYHSLNLVYAKNYIIKHPIPFIEVRFEEMLKTPRKEILRVIDFLNLNISLLGNAVKNVDQAQQG